MRMLLDKEISTHSGQQVHWSVLAFGLVFQMISTIEGLVTWSARAHIFIVF